jgi:hypothetical protein
MPEPIDEDEDGRRTTNASYLLDEDDEGDEPDARDEPETCCLCKRATRARSTRAS